MFFRSSGESWQWINRSLALLWPKDFDVDPRDSQTIYLGASDTRNIALNGGSPKGVVLGGASSDSSITRTS